MDERAGAKARRKPFCGVLSIICAVAAVVSFLAMVYVPQNMPRGDIAEGMARAGAAMLFLLLGTVVGAAGALLGIIGRFKRKEGPLPSWGIVINVLAVASTYLILLILFVSNARSGG